MLVEPVDYEDADEEEGEEIPTSVTAVEVLPGGKHAFIVMDDGTIHLWDTNKARKDLEMLHWSAEGVGRRLAHSAYGVIEGYSFQVLNTERAIVLAVISRPS